jgi:hypothetical protein
MLDDNDYRELVTRLSTALAMTEASYMEARKRRYGESDLSKRSLAPDLPFCKVGI